MFHRSKMTNKAFVKIREESNENRICLIVDQSLRQKDVFDNNFNRMDNFQSCIDLILKSLLRLADLHLTLYQFSNLKILNSEQLSQSPYISDEIALARAELLPIKHQIETVSHQAKQAIDHVLPLPAQDHHQEIILCRMITRSVEVVCRPCEQEITYYSSYNQRFRAKCSRMLEGIKEWEASDIARVLYKYFRHIVLMELERYEEILQCMAQTDFDSIKHFREYFYQLLQKKESQRKEEKIEQEKKILAPPNTNYSLAQSLPSNVQSHRPQTTHQHRTKSPKSAQQLKASELLIEIKVEKTEEYSENMESSTSIQHSTINQTVSSQSKAKANAKSLRKLHNLISSVMEIKKDHYPTDSNHRNWEQKSLYTDLMGRNKPNQQQISNYYHYSQYMSEQLSRRDPKSFFYYQQETNPQTIQIERSFEQTKRTVKMMTARQKESPLTVQPKRKQPTPMLSNPLQKRKEYRVIHKSIQCKSKGDVINGQSKEAIEQKPLKIDSEFLQINLRKIIPTRRQSQMEQMVSRASSLTFIRNDHHRRFQAFADNAAKVDKEVFKSVRILHQNEFNGQREARVLKEARDKLADHSHHDRIENKIKEQLRQAELLQGRHQQLKKRIIFKKH